MPLHYRKISRIFSLYVIICLILNFGCSKDNDLFIDSIIDEPTIGIEEKNPIDESEIEGNQAQEEFDESASTDNQETTTIFSTINDAHVQSGKGFNEKIILLEKTHRISYLMFDLSPIEELGLTITEAVLQFTIDSNGGNGSIKVFKGTSSSWNEDDLNDNTAPGTGAVLGSVQKEYDNNSTVEIALNISEISPDVLSLILEHNEGNGLAFASKEHGSKVGPKLIITHALDGNDDETSDESVTDETSSEETSSEETTSEETTSEETTSEETTSEETTTEEATTEEATTEETTTEETTTEETTTEETTTEETTTEETTTEETTTEETTEEVTNQKPTAVAIASPISGEAPLEVTFTGSNSTDDNGIVTYAWTLNPGAANAADFKYTYTNPGTYEVQLLVKDEQGLTDSASLTITVTEPVNEAPTAKITANKTSGDAPLNVQFYSTNSTDDKGITNYLWDFKDGSTSTMSNPSHTFTEAGNYSVALTTSDAEGLTSTDYMTINVVNNVPPGYYVSTTGSSSNDGKSPSKPWNIQHAFSRAQAGDVVYVKAGNYGNVKLVVKNSGYSGNPISFIGYKNTPGDISSNNGPSYTYNDYKNRGDNLDPSQMPLLLGVRSNQIGTGMGIEIRQESNIIIENFMIAKYEYGIFNSGGNNNIFKNIITTDHGDFNPQNSWSLGNAPAFRNLTGTGIRVVSSNQVEIINSIAINNGARGLALVSTKNSKIKNSSAYSDNNTNPTDYYIMLYGATQSEITNCHVERVGELAHFGHGFSIKVDAAYNEFRNCTTKGTSFELNNRVHHNTFKDCHVQGTGEPLSGGWEVTNYSYDNTFIRCSNDSGEGIVFSDWPEDDGNNGINTAAFNNMFENCTITNVVVHSGAAINFHYNSQAGRLTSFARDNTFKGCTFSGAKYLFKVDRVNSGNQLINCTISNVENLRDSRYDNNKALQLGVSFQNNSTSNIGFTLPD